MSVARPIIILVIMTVVFVYLWMLMSSWGDGK